MLRFLLILSLCGLSGAAISDDAFWVQSCAPPSLPCRITGGALILWGEGHGKIQGLARHPDIAFVYLREGNQRWVLGTGQSFALSPLQAHRLGNPTARIEAEFSDGAILHHPTTGLVNLLPGRSGTPPSPAAAPLTHFAIEEDRRIAPPGYLVPSTKPQAEFAIRAQGGTSIFSETGR